MEENITYTSPSADEFTTVLINAGEPAEYISLFSAFSLVISAGEFDKATVLSYLESVYAK